MLRNSFAVLTAFALLCSSIANAGGLPYLVGTEASVEAIAQVFASPALPSLDGDGRKLTPMFGIVTVKGVDDTGDIPAGQITSVYSGQVQGNIASLTFSSTGSGDLGYFIFLAGTKLSGGMTSTLPAGTDTVKDIAATGISATGGVSYRLLGSDKSLFALGLFAGPAYMSVTSTEHVDQSTGTPVDVAFNGNFYGIYGGLQLLFRLGSFKINPYLSSYQDKSEHCRHDINFKGIVNVTSLCQNGVEGFEIDSSLFGVGMNLGYGPFAINVYSEGTGVHRYLKATSYALSFGIRF